MLKFKIAFLFLTAVIASPAVAFGTTSIIAINASDESQLSFHVEFGAADSVSAKLSATRNIKSLSTTSIPVDDTTSLEVQIACFLIPPGGKARLVSSSQNLGAKAEAPVQGFEIPDSLLQIRLARPVMVRGMLLGKVIIPLRAKQGGAWFNVASADATIRFDSGNANNFPRANGRLDKIISDLAINADIAASWLGKALLKFRLNPTIRLPNHPTGSGLP